MLISSMPSAFVPVLSLAEGTNTSQPHKYQKLSSSSGNNRCDDGKGRGGTAFSVQHVPPLAMVDPSRFTVELANSPVISMARTSVVPVASDASPCVIASDGGRLDGRQQ
ncbi:Hypothetical predicted protein [Olea europaea subsp. europaea]|uniref:Uncharacterized protein n=1 Tax=Olea europaea subsp. europaea TaxID=158383 RepID=A0A8S0RYH6_OLEEU|nr:Hypothetical predicted protein [Olea europaea subsp. europaea]